MSSSISRLPHAPLGPMPELEEFLRPFTVHFVQRPSATVLERYVSGLLTECPNKNCDTIAQSCAGHERAAVAVPADRYGLGRARDQRAARLGDAHGRHRGRCGDHYLPESWATDADARRRSRVPEDVEFQTKPEIALSLLDEEKSAWVTLSWREGSRGRERAKFRALRLWRVDTDGTRHVGWLIGQCPARGQKSEEKWRATSPPGCRSTGCWSTRTAGGGSRNTTRKRSSSWAGMSFRGGDTTRFTGTRWPSC